MYDDILVPTDGSESIEQALDHAVILATRFDATLHTVHVVQTPDLPDTLDDVGFDDIVDRLDDAGQQALDAVHDRAADAGHADIEATLCRGVPEVEIREYADEYDVDLVVMATEGRTGDAREMLGSVTEEVVRSGAVPVLTVNVG